MDLTDEELDYTRIQKELVSMKNLDELEKKYKGKKITNKIYKQKIDKVVKRLLGVDYEREF